MGEVLEPFQAPAKTPTAKPAGHVPFEAHVELLQRFLGRRAEIVERIQGLLNAQRKPIEYLQDSPLLSRHFEDCFFSLRGITHDQSRLRSQLQEAHWESGFRPRESPGLHNDLVDPGEMMKRGFVLWRHTRWPGRNGRVQYAQTLFSLYVIRSLALLTMRIWDDGASSAGDRLSHVQGVLDHLNKTAPADQPVLVRDARWLIPVAQSPTTDELAAYFTVAEQVAETLPIKDRSEIHKASVRMAGGHLRSQLRHRSVQKAVPLDEISLVLSTRKSNALDLALLIQGLVPLLQAYEHAIESGDGATRLELADSICQGISPDPELFVNRLELLGPYSMIEYLFATRDRDGHVVYTPAGQRHVALLHEYEARIGRAAKALHDDCRHFRPVEGTYSPFGVLYGFSSNLLEHMALKALQPDAVTRFSLEDVFVGGAADKLAWVSGWRRLPHIQRDVAKLFEYPQLFAENIFDRIEHALSRRAAGGAMDTAPGTGRLFLVADDDLEAASTAEQVPEVPPRYFQSSDREIVAAHKAELHDPAQLLRERTEGEFVVSYRTPGGWVALTKDILTEVLGTGRDAKIVGLPAEAAHVLRSMCPKLVVATNRE